MKPEELARWRVRKMKWSQPQAARWWGCSTRSWQRYEEEGGKVPKPLAMRIADPEWDSRYLSRAETLS